MSGEYEFEPIRGLPGVPPAGEDILWQGAPNWWTLSCQAFHVRAVAGYFAAILIWRVAEGMAGGAPALKAVGSALMVAPVALIGLGALMFFGWLNSRTTVYTITSRRVVMRFGAALTKSINIPFTIIEGAALKTYGEGAGDLALSLMAPNKIAFMQLWPHARPWRMRAPEPTLRALKDPRGVADILAQAMRGQVAIAVTREETGSRDAAAPGALRPPIARPA
jgi:hypothetical protein